MEGLLNCVVWRLKICGFVFLAILQPGLKYVFIFNWLLQKDFTEITDQAAFHSLSYGADVCS
jgi:hypothetical protein